MKAINKDKEVKNMTIRFPLNIWKELRRFEESGHIISIQQATMVGLKILMAELKKSKSGLKSMFDSKE
jgi:hypothetical protein